jgi:hypothetical protein
MNVFFKAYIAHLRQECHNSKLVIIRRNFSRFWSAIIFYECNEDTTALQRRVFANCVMTLYLLKVHLQTFLSIPIPQKCQILNCDIIVANERYVIQSCRPARPRPTALLPPRSNGKPEAATAVSELLMMGMRMAETCWAVFKRQVINLRNCCVWLVNSFECMMMHGLAKPRRSSGTIKYDSRRS